jgi:hypothetical protein
VTAADATTPEGLGAEHGTLAAELATLGESPEHLSDDEIVAYFPGHDRAAVLVAYHDAWSEAYVANAVPGTVCMFCDVPVTRVIEGLVSYWADADGDSLSYVPTLHSHIGEIR